MKAFVLYFFLCIPSFLLNAQTETKKLSVKDDKLNILESFYVLNSNSDIKHGVYEKYQDYKLIEKGTYENGKKLVWTFYDLKSHEIIKYDFLHDSLLTLNFLVKNFETYSEDKEKIDVDRPAFPLICESELFRFISRHVEYPEKAVYKSYEGTVKVGIKIDPTGNILDYTIIQKIQPMLDEAALNVIKSFPPEWKWLPAIKDGKKITSYYVIPIKFKIS
jgi:TonB family protein